MVPRALTKLRLPLSTQRVAFLALHSSVPLFTPRRRWLHWQHALSKNFKLADIGEGITEVEVLKWFVAPGSAVKEFDKLCEVQSDKAAVEITSRFSGVVKRLGVEAGKIAKVGETLVEFESAEASEAPKAAASLSPAEPIPVEPSEPSTAGKKLASPAVRHMARQSNLDLSLVAGTGREGRVLKEDVIRYLDSSIPASDSPKAASDSPKAASDSPKASPVITLIPIRGVRREMAKSMTGSLSIPHLTLMEEVSVDKALGLLKDKQVSLLALLIKAASCALLDHAELNASYDVDANELRVHAAHNIAIAVDSPRGLVTPVLSMVQDKSLIAIAADLARIKTASLGNSFVPSDFKNATFTLSNVGSIGGTYATPLITPPLVCIGAFGRARKLPRFDADGSVVASRIMSVSWAADHRVIDGAQMAKFSNLFAQLVEDPTAMLLKMR